MNRLHKCKALQNSSYTLFLYLLMAKDLEGGDKIPIQIESFPK